MFNLKKRTSDIIITFIVIIMMLFFVTILYFTVFSHTSNRTIEEHKGSGFFDFFKNQCEIPLKDALVNTISIEEYPNGSFNIRCIYGPSYKLLKRTHECDYPVYRGYANYCNQETAFMISNALKNHKDKCIVPVRTLLPQNSTKYDVFVFVCKKDSILTDDLANRLSTSCNGVKKYQSGQVLYKKIYYIYDKTNQKVFWLME